MTIAGDFVLMLMTSDPEIAREGVVAGARIFVDLEIKGKAERQAGRSTIISGHTLEDVRAVRAAIPSGELLVRIDPPGPLLEQQVDDVIQAGADIVMLPFFSHPHEVLRFVAAIGGRAGVCLLIETAAAVVRIDPILSVKGIDEIHIGLNDLHLSMGLRFMYELLAGGILDHLADRIKSSRPQIRFGFGGGALLDSVHPVSPRDVLSEHIRLGSEMLILSRTFTGGARTLAELSGRMDLQAEIMKIRTALGEARSRPPEEMEADRRRINEAIWATAERLTGAG